MVRVRSTLRFVLEGLEGLVVSVVTLLTWPVARRWLRNWGSRPEERAGDWPGDALVSADHSAYTRAIGIEVPPDRVWPWLVQFGLGRAGFYSYELLERVLGIPVRNVESIVPDLQSLSVGDEILLHPKAPGIPVAALDEGRHLCFGSEAEERARSGSADPGRSWSMYLEPSSKERTRLILRSCIEPPEKPSLGKRVGGLLEEPVDFIMEQRMLRTVKRLAESNDGDEGGSRMVGRSESPVR